MKPQVKLPRELEEEILSRLPPQSLLRLRSVCKPWNALLDEKCFINNHLSRSRPHFICMTDSKLYSINIIGLDGVDPTTELCELSLSADFPDMNINSGLTFISAFDESLLCRTWSEDQRTLLWNPWLKQVELIEHNDTEFYVCGLGYNNTLPKKIYKIIGFYIIRREVDQKYVQRAAIYDCASQAFKFIDTTEDCPVREGWVANQPHVSLYGNLYWLARNPKTYTYFIKSFDFSQEIFKPFCNLPCPNERYCYKLVVLAVFQGDRFSLFQNSYGIEKIHIWVTEKKIDSNNGEDVVWINLMTLSTSNLPNFSYNELNGLSYFIYDKTLIMCCDDYQSELTYDNYQTELTYIYVLREDMFRVFQINGSLHHCRCVYAPNFTPLPLLRV